MRIKVCGLTRAEDALLAENLGAWALGFIFYPKSPRFVQKDRAAEIIAGLRVPAIGVFVNQTAEALEMARTIPLKGLQLHGDETPGDLKIAREEFGGLLIKALRPKAAGDLAAIAAYRGLADYILIDAAAEGQYGGSGRQADGALAQKAADFGIPVILAGGLNPANVAAAIEAAKPYAVDLSSGIEAAPGVKDPEKMKALFRAAGGIVS